MRSQVSGGYSFPSFGRILLDPAPVAGGGGPAPAPAPAPPAPAPPAPAPAPDPVADQPTKAFQNLLAKHNADALEVALTLFDDNHGLRGKNRELTAQIPGTDAVVLKGADVAAWAEFTKLGGLKTIQEKLTAGETAIGAVAKGEASKIYARAAATCEFDPEVLEDLEAGMTFVFKADAKDKNKEVAHVVTGEGKDAKETPLAEYVKTNFPKYLASLKAAASTTLQKVIGTPTTTNNSSKTLEPNFAAKTNSTASRSTFSL